jgi:hypothetical protein
MIPIANAAYRCTVGDEQLEGVFVAMFYGEKQGPVPNIPETRCETQRFEWFFAARGNSNCVCVGQQPGSCESA